MILSLGTRSCCASAAGCKAQAVQCKEKLDAREILSLSKGFAPSCSQFLPARAFDRYMAKRELLICAKVSQLTTCEAVVSR